MQEGSRKILYKLKIKIVKSSIDKMEKIEKGNLVHEHKYKKRLSYLVKLLS